MNIKLQDLVFHGRQYYGKVVRIFWPKPRPRTDELRLHLGCGAIDWPGFVNIDGIDRPHIHLVQSLTRLNRFKNNSVAFIYTSHTLEHFPRAQTIHILKEWFRVLVPGGRLCVSVPDFDRILEVYRDGGDVNAILPPLFGGQDYPFNFHFTTFNAASLERALKDAGFSSVEPWAHGSDAFHNLPDWSGRTFQVSDREIPISLNLEAVK
jgi:predicted SAM-dependent methyltransferase